MMRQIVVTLLLLCLSIDVAAQNVTVRAVDTPAETVFRDLMRQTGKNFVYSSDLFDGVNVTVNAYDRPLKKVLSDMFRGSDIDFRIKGDDVMLKRRHVVRQIANEVSAQYMSIEPKMLDEVVVVSRLEAPVVESAEIGSKKLTAVEVANTPALFGERDVIRALVMQPGVTEASEGMAGMNVHGGEADENMYMLDNVPLYHVNHFGGLFSAFNTDAIRYIDFFKSSIPAKYDGRLSSFMDVRTRNGSSSGHHGSVRLGLTSGAFNIDGPIESRTTYLFALRRSWYDVLTIPFLAMLNTMATNETLRFNYYFMDVNGKISHRFSSRLSGHVSVYFGDDSFRNGGEDKDGNESGYHDSYMYNFHWGNLVVKSGLDYRVGTAMTAEFTAAYTRYFSDLSHESKTGEYTGAERCEVRSLVRTDNNINDWIFRGDFDWNASDNSRVRFGGNYVVHSFLPSRTARENSTDGILATVLDSTYSYKAHEVNLYIEDDWKLSKRLRINAGIHASMFHIDDRPHYGLSPRLSMGYKLARHFALKASYSRTTQYVHQLAQSYLALPTDQWIPMMGDFKPQSADKVSVGIYASLSGGMLAASIEGYYKNMHNLIDYVDEYYLRMYMERWNAPLTTGRGSAKGIDFKLEKLSGRLTGHISYSLGWVDRTFEDKNGGRTYPARFDNRHKINIVANWRLSDKVQLNAAWTGRSGNRYTLLSQMWEAPAFDCGLTSSSVPMRAELNNYRLPFYHRLDLSCMVNNRRGYWTFGLYNAYCHLNTIAIRRGYHDWNHQSVFEKVKLLPVIPSVSYTWIF